MENFTKYVFDTGPIIDFKHYYEEIFVTLWDRFEDLISKNKIISSIEVYRELKKRDDEASKIADKYKHIFLKPDMKEQEYVKEILKKHKELIRFKSIAGSAPVADPFIIAQAKCYNATLITNETLKPNAHNIPNICVEYKISYINLKEFFKEEKWKF
jgi:hypothetical protein